MAERRDWHLSSLAPFFPFFPFRTFLAPFRPARSPSSLGDTIFFVTLLFVVVLGGAVVARRNLRLGRGDRRGALRLASFVFSLLAAAWILQVHHVVALSEIGLFFDFLGYGMMIAGLVWMVYIALEPYARRLWPNGLISWSRLLSGRVRDPLVGRDLLIGAAAGGFIRIWWGTYMLLLDRLSLPVDRLRAASLLSLSGTGQAIGNWCQLLAVSLYVAVGWLFALLLVRALLRRTWIAAFVVVVFAAGTAVPGAANPVLFGLFMTVAFSVYLLVLVRFGLLASALTGAYLWMTEFVVLTLDGSAWYAGRSFLILLLFAAIAAYGFWTSLAGRPIRRFKVLE